MNVSESSAHVGELREPALAAGTAAYSTLALRGALGGTLMGLANLVPGISGGTMLLAAGVYREFVTAVAEFTTFKFRPRSVVVFGAIVACAALAILLCAGIMKAGVIHYRWAMYSAFIGLTLGGAPLVWRLARPASTSFYVGAVAGFALMVLLARTPVGGAAAERSYSMLFVAGAAGASAMILPGVSGGYLLLLLGQYVPILSGVDRLKVGLSERSLSVILESMHVVIPVGVGVVVGIVGVSNLVQWLFKRYEKPTLGVLFGLLLGAVVGLWPFQAGTEPELGSRVRGIVVTEDNRGEIDSEDWPVEYFTPAGTQVMLSLGLIAAGLGATRAVDRIGSQNDSAGEG